jgi:hypothetical protein
MRCKQVHPLSPEGWPLTREGWIEDGYGVFDPCNKGGVGISPSIAVVEPIAKGYAEGRIGIRANLQFAERGIDGHAIELDAIFYRSVEKIIDLDGPSAEICVSDEQPKFLRPDNDWWEGAVLVHVVDVVKNGERVPFGLVPSVVRLQLFDLFDPSRVDADQPITDSRSPVARVLNTGETMLVRRSVPGSEHQLPDQIIECCSKVGQHVSVDEREFRKNSQLVRRLRSELPPAMKSMGWLSIHIDGVAIGATVDKLGPLVDEVLSVELRPVELGVDNFNPTSHIQN